MRSEMGVLKTRLRTDARENRHFAWGMRGKQTSCRYLGSASRTRPRRLRAMNPAALRPRGADSRLEKRDASTGPTRHSTAAGTAGYPMRQGGDHSFFNGSHPVGLVPIDGAAARW